MSGKLRGPIKSKYAILWLVVWRGRGIAPRWMCGARRDQLQAD